ncbi:MAG: hypothetical protein LBT29_09360 [Flavobacteriaceae bacterium]|jgi:hypothetical protein|nr:hypothetical protein [Flavobacteriaceae bacterium]
MINFKKKTNPNERNLKIFLSFSCLFLVAFGFGQAENKDIFCKNKNFDRYILFYEIIADSAISKNNILRLEYFNFTSFNPGQNTITYDYCKSMSDCERNYYEEKQDGTKMMTHYEMTGFIQNNYKFWIHPPRSYKLLELNAFPYYLNNSKDWMYSLTFNDKWGNKKWIEWEGERTSTSYYKALDMPVVYKLGNQEIECVKIQADTDIPNLGKTSSIFYYNYEYGFVRMIFNTIDGKKIEFNLLKAVHDSDTD